MNCEDGSALSGSLTVDQVNTLTQSVNDGLGEIALEIAEAFK